MSSDTVEPKLAGQPAGSDAGTGTSNLATAAGGWRLRLALPIGLIALIVLAFMPALDAGLVGWDDDDLLLGTWQYRRLDLDSVQWMFTTSYSGHFQPLTWLTFALNWALWKRELFGYHLTALTLHAFTALAFYFVTQRLLVVAAGSRAVPRSLPVLLSAGLAAAVFAVHPLRAEPVSWLAAGEVQAGLFYVLTVACYLRYLGAGRERPLLGARVTRPGFYWLAVACCGVSLLAKAYAVTAPIVLLILDVYPLRRWRPEGTLRPTAARRPQGAAYAPGSSDATNLCRSPCPPVGRVWVEKLPFILLAMAGGFRGFLARAEGGALLGMGEHDVPARLAQSLYGLTFYLWKSVWPSGLGPLYEIPPRETLMGPMLWLGLAGVALLGGAIVFFARRVPSIAVALTIYVVLLIPVLGVVQSGPQLVADRYSYLSCLGLAVLVGGGLLWLLGGGMFAPGSKGRLVLALAVAVLLTVLGKATFAQAEIWSSAESLWERGVKVSPTSAIAHTNYADALVGSLDFAKADRHYQRALELNPYDTVALHHRGDLLRRLGRPDAAKRYYIQSLRIDPSRARACLALAQLLNREGRAEQAIVVLKDGARRRPDALDLISYLADMLATHPDERIRNGDEAIKWATHVIGRRGAGHSPSLLILAAAYAEAGHYDRAIETSRRALELARERQADRLVAELHRRLALYRNGTPFHRSVPDPGPSTP